MKARIARCGLSIGLLIGCGGDLSLPGDSDTVLRAEEREIAVMVYGLLSRISVYGDRLLPLSETWTVEEMIEPLGDRFTFYSLPQIATEYIEREQNPLEQGGEVIPTVYVDSVAPGLSVIQVTEFRRVTLEAVEGDTSGTWREFRQALKQTEREPVTIIDLRNNPGGSVAICLGMADELVPAGEPLIRIEDRSAPWNGRPLFSETPAQGGGWGEGRDFIFLANRWSASCSELFLAAVRGTRNDLLIGETTYGKGIGQSLWVLPDGGMMRVTSMVFWGPDGTYWNGTGLVPDLEVTGREEQLACAVEQAAGWKKGGNLLSPPPIGPVAPLSGEWSELDRRLKKRTTEGGDAIGTVAEATPLAADLILSPED